MNTQVRSATSSGKLIFALCLSLLGASLSMQAAPHAFYYLSPEKTNLIGLLVPPPVMSSPEQAADMATVASVHYACTSNDLAAAFSAANFSMFSVTNTAGALLLQHGKYPKVESLLRHAQRDASAVVASGKEFYKRPRPYVTDPRLAMGGLDHEFSYPSGHSTGATTLALVMAELFPNDRELILAQGRFVGWHRVEIARHYPTDIYAGRVLAQAIVREMKKNPEFLKDLAQAKGELAGQ